MIAICASHIVAIFLGSDGADKLPTKRIRLAVFALTNTALGLLTSPIIGASSGLGLSALDSFLLDKVMKGWRPNHFIEGPLKHFIESQR